MIKLKNHQKGQTLIALLIFMLVAMTVTLGAIAIAITNIQSNTSFSSGEVALDNANSGIEEAILNLERNPSYTGGTITLNSGTATISISGSGPISVVSVGKYGTFVRTVTADLTNTNSVISLNNWSETP